MFNRFIAWVLIYLQIVMPQSGLYEAMTEILSPPSAYADQEIKIQNPVCEKRCYDARTDNQPTSNWYFQSSSGRTQTFTLRKGINIGVWAKVRVDGYYVQGNELNIRQSGGNIVVSFLHPDGETYGITLKGARLNTWVVFNVSINPNFIAGVLRNADTGEFDEQVYEFPYNPLDSDDPTKTYTITYTEGVYPQGMYYIAAAHPHPSGVRPFCSEEIAFCHREWSAAIAKPYNTDPNRLNFSVSWWPSEAAGGTGSCTWYNENSKSYFCNQNRGTLFTNTPTELRDGAEGLWYRKSVRVDQSMSVPVNGVGILQSKTENNIKETYGQQIDFQSMSWSLAGFRRPGFTVPIGQIYLSDPPAIGTVSVSSNRRPTWVNYTFSNNWFWTDTGHTPGTCPSAGGKTVNEVGDGCYSLESPLCPSGQVNLYPTYDRCYQFIENAGCWHGQTQFTTGCWLYQRTPDICPSDGNTYTLLTPPTYNYMCYTSRTPSCPYGTVQIGGDCYRTTSPSCPSGTQLISGSCYLVSTPSCSRGQMLYDGTCYNLATTPCSSGWTPFQWCMQQSNAGSTCRSGQALFEGYCHNVYSTSSTTCSSGYSYISGCMQYSSSGCPSGYSYDSANWRCVKYYSSACPSGYYWDSASNRCRQHVSSACDYGSGWYHNSSNNKCEKFVPAECPSGQTKYTNPSTGNYACYVPDLSRGNPPGHIYCRNNLTFFNNRCYQYKQPICNSKPYDIILGSANSYGEWTGNCWKNYYRVCPPGTFKGRGQHTNNIRCLKPNLEASVIISPVSADTFSNIFCNSTLFANAGQEGYKPCLNIVQAGGWRGSPDSFYVGWGKGPWTCPLNPQYSCTQITEFIAMCGTDKPCVACYPDNIKDDAYKYIEIQEIKTIPNTNPVKKTGMYKYKYAYPNAKIRISSVWGRLPEPSEVSVIQSLWGVTDFWVNGRIPPACQSDPNSSGCLSDERTTIVVWDDTTKAGFYAPCVYDQQGNAICTGDAVECVNNVCPLGSAYPCVNYNGKKICSTTKCYSAADPTMGETEFVTIDDSMYENDGERDEDGNCLGQVYIFTGKASRCRPPGLRVGLLNDCCDGGGKTMSDSTGSALDVYGTINTIKTVYHLGQVAYFTDKLTGLTRGVNFDIFYFKDGAAQIVNYGTGKITEVTAEVAKAVDVGLTAGTGVEGAITHFVKNLLNPTTILITVAVMIVTKLLFGSCDQKDITTVLLRDSKYCHFVGNYCEKKWPIIGCVQKAKSYCCFNSKLARIIHEQGRPQLESFGRDGGWGKAKKPNCRGFKPEEFQMLDFSKIDISEYIEDIQKNMDKKLNNMQKNLNDKVNNLLNLGAN